MAVHRDVFTTYSGKSLSCGVALTSGTTNTLRARCSDWRTCYRRNLWTSSISRLDRKITVAIPRAISNGDLANATRSKTNQTIMTPAVAALEVAGIPFRLHSYDNEVVSGYAAEAASALAIPQVQVFKTLIAQGPDKKLYAALVPTPQQLNLKLLAKAIGVKKTTMAEQSAAERSTGYLKGGISPLGQKAKLTTYLDSSAHDFDTIFVSAGRRGLEIEIAPDDLIELLNARVGEFSS